MDSKIIAALIGLIGISVGAFLGGLGYYLKTSAERKQNRKTVLFHLLHIHHVLVASEVSSKEITSEYLRCCDSCFSKLGIEKEHIPDEIKAFIANHFSNIFQILSPKISPEFVESFKNSLDNLYKDDPILAFRLRGKEQLTEISSAQNKYISDFCNSEFAFQQKQNVDSLETHLNVLKNKAAKEIVRDIKNDILLISRYCGIRIWFKSFRIIRQKPKTSSCFRELGIEDILETTFTDMLGLQTKNKSD